MVELVRMKPKAKRCIAKAFPVGQLPKGHAKKLLPAGQGFGSVITIVPLDAVLKNMKRSKLHDL